MKYDYITEKTYETEKAIISYRLSSSNLIEVRKAQKELELLEKRYREFRENRNGNTN